MIHRVDQTGKRMLEKEIERKLTEAVHQRSGRCLKWAPAGTSGLPDRIVLMPGGKLAFVELKAPGKKPRPLQLRRHAELRELGFQVFVLDDTARIEEVLNGIA